MAEPPDSSSSSAPSSNESPDLEKLRTSKRVSWVLDECIRVPGTDIRFGLDPILGLIPYGGETVATVIGASILGDAGKKGIPFKTLVKMSGNMLLNAGVGAIPVIGDLFSVWFKSNSRNYRMLSHYLDDEEGSEEPGGWWPVIFIFAVVGIVLTLNVLSWILMASLFIWSFQQLEPLLNR